MPSNRSLAEPQSILIIKPGSLGDIIHTLPVAAALHAVWPGAKLIWLIDPRWAPILNGNPAITAQISFPRQQFKGPLGLVQGARWAWNLGSTKPDITLDLQGLLRSALIARLAGSKSVIGLSDAREGAHFFYAKYASVPRNEHAVSRYLRVLDVLNIPRPIHPTFWIPEGTPIHPFPLQEPFLLLHPFARGAGKSLSTDQIVYLCRTYHKMPIVIAGMGKLEGALPSHILNLTNQTTLEQLIWLIRRASYIISVDSGPMHIAAALTPNVLSIHTWSDPRCVGPFSESAWIWQGGAIRKQHLGPASQIFPKKPISLEAIEEIASWLAMR